MAKAAVREYREKPLPAACPPSDASDAPKGTVLRLVANSPPVQDDFRSGRAEGKKKPKRCDDCTWCACSVWLSSTKKEVIAGLTKLANHRNKKYIAHVQIDAKSGKTKPHDGDGNHVRFWMYETFDPVAATVNVEII
jgi:hypothetical protein